MKKYLISGVPPSSGGVGRLMRKLAPDAIREGFHVITLRENLSLKKMLRKYNFIAVSVEVFLRLFSRFMFWFRLRSVNNSIVIFIHPQTARFENLFRLSANNKVYLYVMDNSFFCMRSYNLHPIKHVECLECIESPYNSHQDCKPFPFPYAKKKNIGYLEKLRSISGQINFLAQNHKQKTLLQKTFGSDIYCEVIGLDTGEVFFNTNIDRALKSPKYDLVFHGAPNLAKGIEYFIQLAELLSELSCFVPSEKVDCELAIGRKIITSNIDFVACDWETGLKDIIESSLLVLNPSLWSAPIEGALLKSIAYGRKVATVQTSFGFESEISDTAGIIRLPRDISLAAKMIYDELEESKKNQRTNDSKSFDTLGKSNKSIFDVVGY